MSILTWILGIIFFAIIVNEVACPCRCDNQNDLHPDFIEAWADED